MKEQLKTKLSPHFTLFEMVRSGTAIDNCIVNHPTATRVEALRQLCINVLEPLREEFGPIVISSGFRNDQLNILVGGVPGSQHTRGEAVDIVVNTKQRALAMAKFLEDNTDFDQLIFEPIGTHTPQWLHVSYTTRRANRHEVIGRQ